MAPPQCTASGRRLGEVPWTAAKACLGASAKIQENTNRQQRSGPQRSRKVQHLLTIRKEASGEFTAQAVGVADAQATAATREAAIQHVTALLNQMLARGLLEVVQLQEHDPLHYWAKVPPDDPMEKAYREELARAREEDRERALREYEKECSSSSSTPTT
jgi:hypothetical protein